MIKKHKYLILISSVILILLLLFFLGPKPVKPRIATTLPGINSSLTELEIKINRSEEQVKYLRPENRARIIWADSLHKTKTKYSIVYLHGFSGTWMDGYPANVEFAKRYGCNLFLSRLRSHGVENQNPLVDLTPENYMASAAYALSVGKALGDSLIVMATSTGGTLALTLAKDHPEIAALILYSPNIDVYDKNSFILTMPWGLQAARFIKGGNFIQYNDPADLRKYWLQKIRLEALVTLKSLIANTMNEETFSKVKQPVFLGYYYKNENEQDNTVSVKREIEMFSQLGTPEGMKRKVNFPMSATHPIACGLMSKDASGVMRETFSFAESVLKLKPVKGK